MGLIQRFAVGTAIAAALIGSAGIASATATGESQAATPTVSDPIQINFTAGPYNTWSDCNFWRESFRADGWIVTPCDYNPIHMKWYFNYYFPAPVIAQAS